MRLFDKMKSSISHAPARTAPEEMRFLRGMWIWSTAQLVTNDTQVDRLLHVARTINLTDVYLYVAPHWYQEKGSDIANFNTKINTSGIRVWALDGDVHYIDNATAQETFMQGLQGLVDFNQRVEPHARFHGFQADIEPQDSAQHTGFGNGKPESQLSPQQYSQRNTLIQKWVSVLTRASDLVRSQGMPFGAAMPFWLHDYEGQPVTVPSAANHAQGAGRAPHGPPSTYQSGPCVQNVIMPLLDEYVVMSYNTDPANAASRVVEQAKYASTQGSAGQRMPRVLGAVETEKGVGKNVSYGDTPGRESRRVVLEDVGKLEGMLERWPAFGGIAIHHWAAWEELGP